MNAITPCAFDGCVRTVHEGFAFFRVNPKGEKGIFMCLDHAKEVNAWANRAD